MRRAMCLGRKRRTAIVPQPRMAWDHFLVLVVLPANPRSLKASWASGVAQSIDLALLDPTP